MFCSNCGKKVSGNFCSTCGASLDALVSHECSTISGWENTHSFSQLIQSSKVRNLLEFYASQSRKNMSASEILNKYDQLLGPITGGVPLELISTLIVPLYSKIGVKMGKNLQFSLDMPVGKVIVSSLCSMALQGWVVEKVDQGKDGCIIEGVVPSDLFSWEGKFVGGIFGDESASQINAGITIKGQLYDWGKSKRALKKYRTHLMHISNQI